MLSIDPIARVTLNLNQASATPAAFDTGLILAPAATTVTEAMRLRVYTDGTQAAAGILADGFQTTDVAYQAALKYFGASPSPARLLFSSVPESETAAEGLAAVLARTSSFYGVFWAGDGEEILPLEEALRAAGKPLMLFVPMTGTAAQVTASGGVLDTLHGLQSRRALATWVQAPADAAAVMGTAMGLQLSHSAGAFSLCYKTVFGIQPLTVTEAEADAVKALNGNVYLTRGYNYTLLERGTVTSGNRYHEVLYLDMLSEELQQAAIGLLAGSAELLPQTDDTTALFLNEFTAILVGYTDRRILATGPWRGGPVGPLKDGDPVQDGFLLWADSYDSQSDADRAAHKAVPIQAALLLSGSVESVVISLNVTL